MEKPIIEVNGLSKKYRLGEIQPYYTLRDSLAGLLKNPFAAVKSQLQKDEFWALKDINFTVNQGEVVGIIGRNGAGKSTLLKILSQITPPTEGEVILRGRVGSLLEVGTGFSPELTGRENIYLNGAVLGMKRTEVKKKFDEIVAFSEVEKFLDTPLKRYSSGMYMRLAFAVAAHLEPEILIVDEVLAVGDAEFQKKCLGKMGEVAGQGRTVLFVSHNMGAVKNLCKFGVLLRDGMQVKTGQMTSVMEEYVNTGRNIDSNNFSSNSQLSKYFEGFCIKVNGISMEKFPTILSGVDMKIQVAYSSHCVGDDLCISFGLRSRRTNSLLAYTHNHLSKLKISLKNTGAISCNFDLPYLNPGDYDLESQIWINSRLVVSETIFGLIKILPNLSSKSFSFTSELPSELLVKTDWKVG